MMMDRRRLLVGAAAAGATLTTAGCSGAEGFRAKGRHSLVSKPDALY